MPWLKRKKHSKFNSKFNSNFNSNFNSKFCVNKGTLGSSPFLQRILQCTGKEREGKGGKNDGLSLPEVRKILPMGFLGRRRVQAVCKSI